MLQFWYIYHIFIFKYGFWENVVYCPCLYYLFQAGIIDLFRQVTSLQAYQSVRKFITFLPPPYYWIYPFPQVDQWRHCP